MDGRTRRKAVILAVAGILLAIVMVAGALLTGSRPGTAGTAAGGGDVRSVISGTGSSATAGGTAKPEAVPTARQACDRTAPAAVRAYTTLGTDREALIGERFLPDAHGLDAPADEIPRPGMEPWTPTLLYSTSTTAICGVYAGDDQPWTVTLRLQPSGTWLSDGILPPGLHSDDTTGTTVEPAR
jgi:hypothetical protein